jgi:hypothetical protein
MNAEKELLLALLIEKYSFIKEKPELADQISNVKNKRRRSKGNKHNWTMKQNEALIQLKNHGFEWPEIARRMTRWHGDGHIFSTKSCNSQWYNLQKAIKAAS